MLLAASALKGYAVEAQDGAIGTVKDLQFDDRTWQIRWLVVDTGRWLTERKVLLHPSAIGKIDYGAQTLRVALSRQQVQGSPALSSDLPVSRQHESDLYGYYGWSPLWGGDLYGSELAGAGFGPSRYFGNKELYDDLGLGNHGDSGDPHLRSVSEVKGYHVHATDGDIGHVDNLMIDDGSWGIRYLVLDTSNWWMGKQVLMSPYAVSEISWSQEKVYLDVTRERVKASPAWDPAAMINDIYEKRLHEHYGWSGYGW
ncbi:PRC-barrel domain-containing protein [Bosea sp. PAMC 26642]|uniref:PRC-barrel domain-containing protein n=1 Tax=Bosea sp. (strain PAMC 26642) TaxID=1792307 RepID=UPI0007705B08|nr:PRC-barrel domain-containing protein [Bosea sp. PAMC 26642]AMJ59655.1 hypothetical protein AXW83_04455 [Bosea sp. PAMC 26642]